MESVTTLPDFFVRWNAVPAMPDHFSCRNSVPAYRFSTYVEKSPLVCSAIRISNFEKPLWEEEEDVLVEDQIDTGEPAYLIVYNDDHNSFEWVIECFMTVLQHSSEQSEQLAIIIHYKGKATVKTGTRSQLLPLCSALLDRGLSAEVEGGEEEA